MGGMQAGCLKAGIDLSEWHPIMQLERKICPIPQGIEIELHILPRRDCDLPIGLHPVLALPERPGAAELEVGGLDVVWSHPSDPSPDLTPALPGHLAPDLSCIATANGVLDVRLVPLEGQSETRLLAVARDGWVRLTDHVAGVVTTLRYDAGLFPATMLWISNRGRAAAPWSGRHLALGVEPVRACFDLGVGASRATTPLRESGVPTCYSFRAGERVSTRYQIISELF